jgi:hypothetical protein
MDESVVKGFIASPENTLGKLGDEPASTTGSTGTGAASARQACHASPGYLEA